MRSRLVVALAVAALLSLGAEPASAAGTRLHLDLDNGETVQAGTTVRDDSGTGANGVVEVLYRGALRSVAGVNGTRAVRFPAPCTAEPCPNAVITIADRSALDPGTASFEWGAMIKLSSTETAAGANVLQKGLYDQPGGQWKLQVDGYPGRPSCILSGTRADGRFLRTIVRSSTSVASGTWRQVTCRRTSTRLALLVDGVVTARVDTPLVKVSSNAPVTVGAKSVEVQNNDQFLGALDEVFMRVL